MFRNESIKFRRCELALLVNVMDTELIVLKSHGHGLLNTAAVTDIVKMF